MFLTAVGAQYKMPVPTGYGKNGVDFDVCYRSFYIAIETKVHPNTITTQQQDFLTEVIAAGGIGILAYSLRDVYHALAGVDLCWRKLSRISKE